MLFQRKKTAAPTLLDVQERLASGEIELVDVREPAEWCEGHVRGARHIPLGQLSNRAAELPEGRPVGFMCASGNRSKVAAAIARQHGVDAFNVDGGVQAWHRAGLPLTTFDRQETR